MKKLNFWLIVAVFLLGFTGGVIVDNRYISQKVVYSGDFRVKQRGKGNTQEAPIVVNPAEKGAQQAEKETWRERREEKKAERKLRRKQKRNKLQTEQQKP